MSDAFIDPDFLAMAEDELKRAITIRWRELVKVTPWGDTFEGISPAGRNVEVERNYLWASEPGGDILVEITVFGGPSRYDAGAKVSRVIQKGP
ncbi:MAG: hypothetical protein Q8L66_14590 [Caulobacter sp.]|nr:hypothetical protein [Caulobacter sp.]